MKVIIATEYGGEKGMGHLTRCTALAQAFDEKNVPVTFLVEGEGPLFDPIEVKHVDWKQNPELFSGYKIAIIDSYTAPLSLYEAVAKKVKKPVYMDDFGRLPYPRGCVVNALGKNLPFKEALLGLDYVPLRKQFWDIEKKPLQEVKKIFISMGGTDPFKLKTTFASIIKERFPHLELSEMKEADIALSAGGQTLFELASLGVPTVAIGIAENQRDNIEGLLEKKALLFAGWRGEEHFIDHVIQSIEKLHSQEAREALARDLVDGQGARRIVEYLL